MLHLLVDFSITLKLNFLTDCSFLLIYIELIYRINVNNVGKILVSK